VEKTESLKLSISEIREKGVIIGQSLAFQEVREFIRSYSKTDYPILITGDSGTGKDLVAEKIHRLSQRKEQPFLVQNCSAIPEPLLESELFGYQEGAFPGAMKEKIGLLEVADGGTIFLDEIGDMPINLQTSLLRVIQTGEIKPLGSTRTKQVDIRMISATNKDIRQMVADNDFRQDLFFRLSVLPIHLPPLNKRREDIPLLMNHFLKREALRMEVPEKKVRASTMQALIDYPWTGNVRELENLVRYLLVIAEGEYIEETDLPTYFVDGSRSAYEYRIDNPFAYTMNEQTTTADILFGNFTWIEVEKAYVLYLMKKHNWNITRAAKDAGLKRSTFASRIKKLSIPKKPV
jgi:transcriptional regulator with PAS, ATPase and Fis domain